MTLRYFPGVELVMCQGMPVPPHIATEIRIGVQRTKSLYIALSIPEFIHFVADHYLGQHRVEYSDYYKPGTSPTANTAILNALRVLTRYVEIKYGPEFAVGAEIANLTHKLVAAYNYYCEPTSYIQIWEDQIGTKEYFAINFMSLQLFALIVEDTPNMPQTLNTLLNSKLI